MAACARGERMASTLMCSEMAPCSGCSACTVTSTAGAASFLQPGTKSNESAAAATMNRVMRAGAIAVFEFVIVCGSVIGSHRPRERLKIGHRRLKANPAILACILGGDECGLGVDHFEDGGLAARVAHLGQTQALFRRADAGIE